MVTAPPRVRRARMEINYLPRKIKYLPSYQKTTPGRTDCMYFFDAKINYNHRDWDATTYMRKFLDLRRYTLRQPELITFAAIDQEPPDDDTAYTATPLTNHCQ